MQHSSSQLSLASVRLNFPLANGAQIYHNYLLLASSDAPHKEGG